MLTNSEIQDIILLNGEFEKLDIEMKIAVSDWQGYYVDSTWVPNAHDNPEKDFVILERLFKLYDQLIGLFEKFKSIQGKYPELKRLVGDNVTKLATAIEWIKSGDFSFVDAPDKDSFHTSWMKLHQGLIAFVKTLLQ